MTEKIDTSDEECAMVCMIVSNPQGSLRKDGDGWQRRVNDLIRALKDERNMLRADLKSVTDMLKAHIDREKNPPKDLRRRG